ncbi:hypothetical protein ACTXG6_18730 [Pseudonocardia sp. Cha107L01]|uniref:hypothetical protein n=1 Tax=Pseudonocardia sp. Cha107L01 TaxID=3457576 RepID=UPI00403EA11A
MAGTLSFRLTVDHVYQRRFDTTALAEALGSSHWYLLTRRPTVRIVPGSARLDDQILTIDVVTRDHPGAARNIHSLGYDFKQAGARNFRLHNDGAYFSMRMGDELIHGDAWALASFLSGADPTFARQEVLYVGESFGDGGSSNSWKRTRQHEKLQRVYEDHVDADCEIFVAPLSLDRSSWSTDDHIPDTEQGPDLEAYYQTFFDWDGKLLKPTVDLIEHSLIAYFVPPYNEKLTRWQSSDPTEVMRKMRSAGFRLLHVHLSGWYGLARFYSEREPSLVRSHSVSFDLPPKIDTIEMRRLRDKKGVHDFGIASALVNEGREFFANLAEETGVTLKVFGSEAPAVRRPPGADLSDLLASTRVLYRRRSKKLHRKIRETINSERERARKAQEPENYSGKPSYSPSTGSIDVARHEDGTIARLSLHDPETGSLDSTLIFGNPKMGKSNLLTLVMLEAIMTGTFYIVPSDPLDRNQFKTRWREACDPDWIATSVEHTLHNLDSARRIIDVRLTKGIYTVPSKEVPAILFPVDDADVILHNPHGAAVVSDILARGGPAGVGLVLVVSDIDAVKSNPTLMRDLMTCANKSSFMPNGYYVLADLAARFGPERGETWHDDALSLVLYEDSNNAVLGFLTGIADASLTADQAKSTLTTALESNQITPIMEWEMVDDDPESWSNFDINATRWLLRHHEDAWVLIRMISNSGHGSAQGPEMFEWAKSVIDYRYSATLTPWKLGPSVRGTRISVFYADIIGPVVSKDTSESDKRAMMRLH